MHLLVYLCRKCVLRCEHIFGDSRHLESWYSMPQTVWKHLTDLTHLFLTAAIL